MEMDLERVRRNVEQASTEDLLDRATIYREEMERDALRVIDMALSERGITRVEIAAHLECRQQLMTRIDGTVVVCSFCYRPAVESGLGWHRLFGKVPIFRRRISRCEIHLSD